MSAGLAPGKCDASRADATSTAASDGATDGASSTECLTLFAPHFAMWGTELYRTSPLHSSSLPKPAPHCLRGGRRPERAVRLASREIALTQQTRMLDATHRLFGWWHVAHRPFAMTALLAVLIHVIVVVAVGGTWFY